MRMSKLRTSIDAFVKSEGVHARLDHLTAMEINGIRPLLPHALDQMLRIQSVSTDCIILFFDTHLTQEIISISFITLFNVIYYITMIAVLPGL